MKSILFILLILVACTTFVKSQQNYNGKVVVLKGKVFVDKNKNSLLDLDETGFDGIDIVPLDYAVNNLGQLLSPTRTNENGEYSFDGLMERVTYRFNISNPEGFLFEDYAINLNCQEGDICVRNSDPFEGYKGSIVIENISGFESPLIPSDGNPSSDSQLCLKINIDLGPPPAPARPTNGVAVVGSFFIDLSGNGFKEENETWYSGLKLMLIDSQGNAAIDVTGKEISAYVTDSNGRFVFENVVQSESYSLKIVDGLNSNVYSIISIGPFLVLSTTISIRNDGVYSYYVQNLGPYGLIAKGDAIASGNVFYDYNRNLILDGDDIGFQGCVVNIYDYFYGKLLFSAETDQNGDWSASGLVQGTKYRCTFTFDMNNKTSTGIPPSLCINGGQKDIKMGLDNVKPVTPVANGTSDGGIPPAFYVSCFVKGAYNGTNGEEYTIVKVANNASGYAVRKDPGGAQYLTKIAKHKDTGSIYGVSYRPETGDTYLSSFLKVGTGFGPSGQGAIYKMANGTHAITTYVDLLNIFGYNFSGPHRDYNVSKDYTYISKVSLGALDSTPSHLYVSNLFTNEIVKIPLNDVPTISNSQKIQVPNVGCTFESDWQIFAVKVYKGKMYVGGVCDGLSGHSQIDGIILAYNGSDWNTILQFPLNYPERGKFMFSSWPPYYTIRPQPIICNLVFLDNGDMAIAIKDRQGDATIGENPYPDIFLACPNKNGDYELEKNGTCGGRKAAPSYGQAYFPGGHKFLDTSTTQETNLADSIARAGPSQIAATGNDIFTAYEGGIVFIDTFNGTKYNRYQILNQNIQGNFGKSNGLGGISPIDPPPSTNPSQQPIENGRIWFDCNGNGIQDCNEVGFPNIKVNLIDLSNPEVSVASATSDGNGNFKFTTGSGNKYSCSIPSSEIESNFGPFLLSPVLRDPKLVFVNSNAEIINDNLVAVFNGSSSTTNKFTNCHFGIVKPKGLYHNGYGIKLSNAPCSITNQNVQCAKQTNDFKIE